MIAAHPKTPPTNKVIVSPGKILAGYKLKNEKAIRDPKIGNSKYKPSKDELINETTIKHEDIIIPKPQLRPLNPSSILAEWEAQVIPMGIIRIMNDPKSTCPNRGMYIIEGTKTPKGNAKKNGRRALVR